MDLKQEAQKKHEEAKKALDAAAEAVRGFRDAHLIYAPGLPLNKMLRTPFSWKSPLDRPKLEPELNRLWQAWNDASQESQRTMKEWAAL